MSNPLMQSFSHRVLCHVVDVAWAVSQPEDLAGLGQMREER
jgi:hypothetical protein